MLKFAGFAAVLVAAVAGYVHFFVVTTTEAAKYGPICEEWIGEEFGHGKPALISDYWKRWGKLVFEISVARPGESTSRTLLLCVVDKGKGTMMKPGAFENWR